MNKFLSFINEAFELELDTNIGPKPFESYASYFHGMDYVEFITVDRRTVSERVDGFLTLIYNADHDKLVGFRLKGFECFFNEHLREIYKLQDEHFIQLATVIETYVQTIGESIFDERKAAYKAAYRLAKENEVTLTEMPFAMAA